jgi:cell wall hydrolase
MTRMKPEPARTPGPDQRRTIVDWLALTLLIIAADQDVRVLEALAATLIRQARRAQRRLVQTLSALSPAPFPGAAAIEDFTRKLQLCRRIARRALHGSLVDPSPGTTAFHRIGASPTWARDLLPAAIIGSYLFYEVAEPMEGYEEQPAVKGRPQTGD